MTWLVTNGDWFVAEAAAPFDGPAEPAVTPINVIAATRSTGVPSRPNQTARFPVSLLLLMNISLLVGKHDAPIPRAPALSGRRVR